MENMKTRTLMKDYGGNLGWCKPIRITNDKNENAIFAMNEGKIAGLKIGNNVLPPMTYDEYLNKFQDFLQIDDNNLKLSDVWNYYDFDTKELECRSCPWFKNCDAMEEVIE